jgi:hypothetical protein
MKRYRSPKPPQTREEWIIKEVNQLRHGHFVPREIDPPSRTFQIGDKISGYLTDAFVCDIIDDGRIIIIEHTALADRTKEPIGQKWQARWWFDVFPADTYEGTTQKRRRAWNSYVNSSVDMLMSDACNQRFRDNPDYQRGYVWTPDDKLRFIDSIFKGRELGRFIFVEFPSPDYETEVLDGKQRIDAIREFVTAKFRYEGKYYHQYNLYDRNIFEGQSIQYAKLDGSSFKRSELLQIFLEVNAAGVPQSQEHLDKVQKLYEEALAEEGSQAIR